MREIPVSSLGSDKVRVEVDDDGDCEISFPDWPAEQNFYPITIPSDIPTEALLAIVADRLEGAPEHSREHYALRDVYMAISNLTEPDADQIGEGR